MNGFLYENHLGVPAMTLLHVLEWLIWLICPRSHHWPAEACFQNLCALAIEAPFSCLNYNHLKFTNLHMQPIDLKFVTCTNSISHTPFDMVGIICTDLCYGLTVVLKYIWYSPCFCSFQINQLINYLFDLLTKISQISSIV